MGPMTFDEALKLAISALDLQALHFHRSRDNTSDKAQWDTLHSEMQSRYEAMNKLMAVSEAIKALGRM